jgi:hypothetical protein
MNREVREMILHFVQNDKARGVALGWQKGGVAILRP